MVPAYRAYARNMPPEKIYFTDPVIVNPPKHAPIASHGHPFFHLPLTPPREGQILTSLALPSHWICLGPSKNELRDPDVSVTNKISLKSELNQVERTLHSDVEDRCDRKNAKNKTVCEGDLGDTSWPYREQDWPQLKSRSRTNQREKDTHSGEDFDIEDGKAEMDIVEQKRSWSRAGGRKEGRQSWPFEGGNWPEVPERKRSWSRAGGKKEGRQSWPFEGGDWPEAGMEKRRWSLKNCGQSYNENHSLELDADNDVIGGVIEDESAHWSHRKLPNPPKVQLEDQKRRKWHNVGNREATGGFLNKVVKVPPSE